jgi:hypothetical protein
MHETREGGREMGQEMAGRKLWALSTGKKGKGSSLARYTDFGGP